VKRFYDAVDLRRHEDDDQGGGGWQITLDGRGLKTVGGAPQLVPSHGLARALAAEWEAQGEAIDPAIFVRRDLADYAIDVVSREADEVARKVLRYGETDTLLYRADPDEPLYARQQEVWEPIVTAFEQRERVELVRVSGIVHRPQSEASIERLHNRLTALDPFALAGMEIMVSLSASLIVSLMANEPDADPSGLWQAASLEEEWQADLWGREAEAQERRDQRKQQFLNAQDWVRLARGD